jgi:hypothetical protein
MPLYSLASATTILLLTWCFFLLVHHGYANVIDSIARRLHSHATATRARHARRAAVLNSQWAQHFHSFDSHTITNPLDGVNVTLYTSDLNESIQNKTEGG